MQTNHAPSQPNEDFAAATLATKVQGYYQQYQAGTLNNEPARLLCEYLSCQDGDLIAEIGWLVSQAYRDSFGSNGELGGINVIEDCHQCIVDYVTSDDSTWLTVDALIELADKATADCPAPLPDWFELAWMGMTFELAKATASAFSPVEASELLQHLDVETREIDGADEYRIGWRWLNDPNRALIGYMAELSPRARRIALFG